MADRFRLPCSTQRLAYELRVGDVGEAACQVVLTSIGGFLAVSTKAAGRPSHSLSINGKARTQWTSAVFPTSASPKPGCVEASSFMMA